MRAILRIRLTIILLLLLSLSISATTSSARDSVPTMASTNERVSIATDGTQGNDDSGFSVFESWNNHEISADGRYVAFFSVATNLVEGDTNGVADIFLRDRALGVTTRVSVASNGTQGNGKSVVPSISADGRYVAFVSYATNLVGGDLNGWWGVYVHDRYTGRTTRESIAYNGAEASSRCDVASISMSGRFVSFVSSSSNLVPGDTNGFNDVFVRDRGELSSILLPFINR